MSVIKCNPGVLGNCRSQTAYPLVEEVRRTPRQREMTVDTIPVGPEESGFTLSRSEKWEYFSCRRVGRTKDDPRKEKHGKLSVDPRVESFIYWTRVQTSQDRLVDRSTECTSPWTMVNSVNKGEKYTSSSTYRLCHENWSSLFFVRPSICKMLWITWKNDLNHLPVFQAKTTSRFPSRKSSVGPTPQTPPFKLSPASSCLLVFVMRTAGGTLPRTWGSPFRKNHETHLFDLYRWQLKGVRSTKFRDSEKGNNKNVAGNYTTHTFPHLYFSVA